jgi:hypothetical protein
VTKELLAHLALLEKKVVKVLKVPLVTKVHKVHKVLLELKA